MSEDGTNDFKVVNLLLGTLQRSCYNATPTATATATGTRKIIMSDEKAHQAMIKLKF